MRESIAFEGGALLLESKNSAGEMGHRIAKHVYNNQTLMLEKSTYYILDAQGNQMAMYDHKVNAEATVYYLAERNIYGSSRLGTTRDTVNMYIPNELPGYGVVGNRNYELNNLPIGIGIGNVLEVVNDIVYPLSEDSSTISSYEVGIAQVSDYSPFGVFMLRFCKKQAKIISFGSNGASGQLDGSEWEDLLAYYSKLYCWVNENCA